MTTNSAFQQEYLRTLKSMREIASQDQILLAEFDREFAYNLSNIDVSQYIKDGGELSQLHKISSLIITLKAISEYAESVSGRVDSEDNARNWKVYSYTFWNQYVEKMLYSLKEQCLSGKDVFDMAAVTESLPKSKPTKKHPVDKSTPKARRSNFYQEIESQLRDCRGRLPLYNGKTGCREPNCAHCLVMFDNLPLTQCHLLHGKSSPCTKLGWFPHLNSHQWQSLRKHHDSSNFIFKPRVPSAGQRTNPLRNLEYEAAYRPDTARGHSPPPEQSKPMSPRQEYANLSSTSDFPFLPPKRKSEDSQTLTVKKPKGWASMAGSMVDLTTFSDFVGPETVAHLDVFNPPRRKLDEANFKR